MRRVAGFFLVTIWLLMALSVPAAEAPTPRSAVNRKQLSEASRARPLESVAEDPVGEATARLEGMALPGQSRTESVAPGLRVGTTWYDQQHNGTIGRMIGWGSDTANGLTIHCLWMRSPQPNFSQRHYAYNFCTSSQDTVYDPVNVLSGDDYGGYVGVDVTADNRAVPGGHNNQRAGYASHFYWISNRFGGSSCQRQSAA